jgi:Type IIA topoisomerase (DNA gyrase/topo II, topoisomerase IV), A subunit
MVEDIIIKRKISNFLNNEVKDFARYVIETRACPSIMDGLRSGARKIVYAGMVGDLKGKEKVKIKLPSFLGDTMKLKYHHGEMSLHNTSVQMASDYLIKYKPFKMIGQMPDIRNTKISVASRYLSIMRSEHFDMFEYDKELFDIKVEEGEQIEPKYLLPIVPIVLLYRTNSPGFGFSFRSFSYTLDSVIDNCIKSISKGTCQDQMIDLIPEVVGCKGSSFIKNLNKDCYYSIGEFSLDANKDVMTITDLPYNVQSSKYREHLDELITKGYITKYSNLSLGNNIKYVITFPHGRLNQFLTDKWKFFQIFKLFAKVPTDTLNVIDTDGKSIMQLENPFELIDIFVKRRLEIYKNRKIRLIKVLNEKIKDLSNIIRFITLVNDGNIIISKRPISDIKKDLDTHKLPYEVLRISVSKLTKDEILDLEKEVESTKSYLNYIESTSEEDMYISELIDLKFKKSTIIKKENI